MKSEIKKSNGLVLVRLTKMYGVPDVEIIVRKKNVINYGGHFQFLVDHARFINTSHWSLGEIATVGEPEDENGDHISSLASKAAMSGGVELVLFDDLGDEETYSSTDDGLKAFAKSDAKCLPALNTVDHLYGNWIAMDSEQLRRASRAIMKANCVNYDEFHRDKTGKISPRYA